MSHDSKTICDRANILSFLWSAQNFQKLEYNINNIRQIRNFDPVLTFDPKNGNNPKVKNIKKSNIFFFHPIQTPG